jgi:predicted XRE-type DNA-binding protein
VQSDADPVLAAIEELVAAARANVIEWEHVITRAARIKELRAAGHAYRAMQIDDDGPTIIDAVSRNQSRLTDAAAAFRRAIARELVAEGMSRAEIARVFGVSRQRVGMLVSGGTTPNDPPDASSA